MKKVIVMLACVLATVASNAQENTKKFELGCNIGMTTFTNYSGISLFQDATDSYSNWSEAIHLGYRVNNTLFGINFQYGILNTSDLAMNETAVWWDFAPMLRHYVNVGGNWETFLGVKFGLSVWSNNFKYLGDDYSRTRLGMHAELETGIQYCFNSGNYIGLRASFNVNGTNFEKDMNLPTGVVTSDKRAFGGYSLMMQYGVRF
ncbi:MAG: outer membrane beta-barrel protein [Paludibacteraceae bacterium]|nr:outer membrane beta-barrel protein [Paludibacteraceae bacterium]